MKVFSRAVLACLIVALAACGGASDRKTVYMKKGHELFQAENYEKARIEFQNVLQIDPKDIDARFALAETMEKLENWQQAAGHYLAILNEQPNHHGALVNMGRLYLLGAIGSALAPNLGLMLAARFVWGVGAAGPRVTAMAMVRDVYSGERMAKQMSFMMAVFILVPVVAPSLGALLTAVAHWRFVFWFCALASIGVVAWSLRLPETLPDDAKRGLSVRDISSGTRTVLATPGTLWYLAALVPLFGVFVAYLSSSELLLDDVYGLKKWFPLIFSAQAASMGVMMVLNGRIVEHVGLDRLNRILLVAYAGVTVALAAVALGTDGRPRFWMFAALLTLALACHGVLSPNLSSAAMRPLGRVAGLGAAILAMLPTVLGSLIADRINGAFDGNVTPFAVSFGASGVLALLAHERAVAAANRGDTAARPVGALRTDG